MGKNSLPNAPFPPAQRPERVKAKQAKKLMLELLKRYPIVEAACSKVCISRSTHYEWTKKDSNYLAAVEEALRISIDTVTDIAENNIIEKIKQGDTKASVFWLINRHEKYKTRSKLEVDKIERLVLKPVPDEKTVAAILKFDPNYKPPTREEYLTQEEWDRQCSRRTSVRLMEEAERRLKKNKPNINND